MLFEGEKRYPPKAVPRVAGLGATDEMLSKFQMDIFQVDSRL
jgi:hypothetical protein